MKELLFAAEIGPQDFDYSIQPVGQGISMDGAVLPWMGQNIILNDKSVCNDALDEYCEPAYVIFVAKMK